MRRKKCRRTALSGCVQGGEHVPDKVWTRLEGASRVIRGRCKHVLGIQSHDDPTVSMCAGDCVPMNTHLWLLGLCISLPPPLFTGPSESLKCWSPLSVSRHFFSRVEHHDASHSISYFLRYNFFTSLSSSGSKHLDTGWLLHKYLPNVCLSCVCTRGNFRQDDCWVIIRIPNLASKVLCHLAPKVSHSFLLMPQSLLLSCAQSPSKQSSCSVPPYTSSSIQLISTCTKILA